MSRVSCLSGFRRGGCYHVHMAASAHRIVRAWLESLTAGIIELDRDWSGVRAPLFSMGSHLPPPTGLAPASMLTTGRAFGYFVRGGDIIFLLADFQQAGVNDEHGAVYLAGDFNGWQLAVGNPEWQLRPAEINNERVLSWSGP